MKEMILLFVLLSITISAQSNFEMPSIFSDNMVLQQKSNVPFWGKANPGDEIIINTSWGVKTKTKAGSDGNWMTKVKTPKAGGPYDAKLKIGDSEISYKNILIGEVWLCSGQSNMEMPLMGWPPRDTIDGSDEVIKNSTNPNIRLFTVTRTFSVKPEFNCEGSWMEANPQTTESFSATAYFFGKKLYDELKMPIGLIHSSWGGTPVEAWTNGKYVAMHENYKDFSDKLAVSIVDFEKQKKWIENHKVIDINDREQDSKWKNLDFNDAECAQINYDDNNWYEMNLPNGWENSVIGNFDGVVWFRKKVELPDSWINNDLVVELSMIDDVDITFVNGTKVGGYETDGNWQTPRIYSIPKEIVKDKILTIAVRVIDSQGGGGIWGQSEFMKLHPANSDEIIPLNGAWKCLPVAEYIAGKFFVYGAKNLEFFNRPTLPLQISAYTPTTLYNAMINPLIPFTIKGAIWYQGESNTDNPKAYEKLFPMMIENWRTDWKQGNFPFYYAQIAPYKYGPGTNSQRLREAQLKTLSVKNTGMAVTLDIGDPLNIHPSNKKDVGERLASWALTKDYGKKVSYSGPAYKQMKVVGDRIILSFDYDEGMYLKTTKGITNFEIAGEDKVFKKAATFIEEKKVHVYNPEITKPVAVRYCWSDTDEATLFNKFGLPASSFRTDNWEE